LPQGLLLLGQFPIRHQFIDMLRAPLFDERARPRRYISDNKRSGTDFKFRTESTIAGMEMRRRVIVIINRYENTVKPADDWHFGNMHIRRELRKARAAAT